MSAPRLSKRPRRTVTVLGKQYQGLAYRPKFALGILCRDEAEQQDLHARLTKLLPGREVKVLVI